MLEQLESIFGQSLWEAIEESLHGEMAEAVANKKYDRLTELNNAMTAVRGRIKNETEEKVSTTKTVDLVVLDKEKEPNWFSYTRDCMAHYNVNLDAAIESFGAKMFLVFHNPFERKDIAEIIENSTDFPGIQLALNNDTTIGKNRKPLLRALYDVIVDSLLREGKIRKVSLGQYEFIEQNPQNILRLA